MNGKVRTDVVPSGASSPSNLSRSVVHDRVIAYSLV